MNIFVSHAAKDTQLADRLVEELRAVGLTALHPQTDIEPGENWAKKIGKALQDADFILFLLTPGAVKEDWALRKDIEFALGSKKYEGRVFSVFVGPTLAAGEDVPWILLTLPHKQVERAREFASVAKEIHSLCSEGTSSHA